MNNACNDCTSIKQRSNQFGFIKMNLLDVYTSYCLLCIAISSVHCNGNSKPTSYCSDLTMVCTYIESNGYIYVDKNASLMTHVIDVRNESSIIKLVMHPANLSEVYSTTANVHIKEQDRVTKWLLSPEVASKNFTYVSGTQTFNISFTSDDEWTDLVLTYDELKFTTQNLITTNDSGIFHHGLLNLEPNTMTIYNVMPDPKVWNESSVMIMVKHLDLDDHAGDYMLIGAGKEIFKGPPAAFLTGKITELKKYYVATDDIYIAVLHLSKQDPEFEIEWIRIGSKMKEPEEEPETTISDSLSQAMPICFYNESWINEFSHIDDNSSALTSFRRKLADVANKYVKMKQLKFVENISPASVKVVHISTIVPADAKTLPNGAIQALVTIVHSYDSRKALFRWYQMQEIIDAYDAKDKSDGYEFGFKVGKCPMRMRYNWWYVAAALLIIFTTTFFAGVWICTYNHDWKRKMGKGKGMMEKPLPKSQAQTRRSRDLNHVAYINPTITITDEEGQNISINSKHYPNVQSEDDSETEEIFNSNWILKRKVSTVENPERKQSQIHLFKSSNPADRVSQPNLVWFKDSFSDTFRSQEVVEVHDPPNNQEDHSKADSETRL